MTREELPMFEIGAAKADITGFRPGVGMMGFAQIDQTVEGVAHPLSARAFVIRSPQAGGKVAIVVAEICFTTQAIKQGVVEAL
jgi:hypothetical protein